MQTDPQRSNGSSKRDPAAAAPPHDIAAEAAVLSAILLKPAVLDDLRDLVEPIDFWHAPHRALFDALMALDTASKRIDVVTVKSQLEADGCWQRIGGAAFLGQITDATPSVANVADHARLVRELGVLRRMGNTLRDLAATAQRAETRGNVAGFLERCEAEVFGADRAGSERETASTARELMTTAAEEFNTQKPQQSRGVSTGLRDVDTLTLGFRPGELWYLAARPGKGKTAMALGFLEAVAGNGHHAALFSMEMKRPEINDRMLSAATGVPFKALLERKLTPEQLGEVMTCIARLGKYPYIVDDAGTLSPARLRSRLRRHEGMLRAQHPHARLSLVIVDYVQLMAADHASGSRNDDLEAISRSLKIIAGDFGCTVVALSQLKRPDSRAGASRPGLTDLRGSGALEQDADKVLFIHRADDDEEGDGSDAELILAKGRNAGTGKVNAVWQKWYVRFVDRPQEGFAWAGPGYDGPESGEPY
jgi:replicative DNA helicase